MSQVSEREIALIAHMAREIRVNLIRMCAEAENEHVACSLAVADLLAILSFDILRHDPVNPGWDERDRFVLSTGQYAPAWYACMALSGYFPMSDLATFSQFGSPLQVYPEHTRLSGIETTTGLPGEGLSQAAGIALSGKMAEAPHHVYALTSDREHQRGVLWEAVLGVTPHKLSNLTNIVIRNNTHTANMKESAVLIEPLVQRYESFEWRVHTVDGHNVEMCMEVLRNTKKGREQPVAIVVQTILGKGVSAIEGDPAWQNKAPSHKEAEQWISHLGPVHK